MGNVNFSANSYFQKFLYNSWNFRNFPNFKYFAVTLLTYQVRWNYSNNPFILAKYLLLGSFETNVLGLEVILQFFRVPNSYNSLVFSSACLVIWHFTGFFLVIFSTWYFFSSSLTALMTFLTVFHSDTGHIKSSILICTMDISLGKNNNIYI